MLNVKEKDFYVSLRDNIDFWKGDSELIAKRLGVLLSDVQLWLDGKLVPRQELQRAILCNIQDKESTQLKILTASKYFADSFCKSAIYMKRSVEELAETFGFTQGTILAWKNGSLVPCKEIMEYLVNHVPIGMTIEGSFNDFLTDYMQQQKVTPYDLASALGVKNDDVFEWCAGSVVPCEKLQKCIFTILHDGPKPAMYLPQLAGAMKLEGQNEEMALRNLGAAIGVDFRTVWEWYVGVKTPCLEIISIMETDLYKRQLLDRNSLVLDKDSIAKQAQDYLYVEQLRKSIAFHQSEVDRLTELLKQTL